MNFKNGDNEQFLNCSLSPFFPNLWPNESGASQKILAPERGIAVADCGFGGRTHPQIAWAKLKSLVEGAALASKHD